MKMIRFSFAFLILISIATSCTSTEKVSEARQPNGIYGKDDRRVMRIQDHPAALTAMWRDTWQEKDVGPCVAIFISDCHLITAGHCVIDKYGIQADAIQVQTKVIGEGPDRYIKISDTLTGAKDFLADKPKTPGRAKFLGRELFDDHRERDWAILYAPNVKTPAPDIMIFNDHKGDELIGQTFAVAGFNYDLVGTRDKREYNLTMDDGGYVVSTDTFLMIGNHDVIKMRVDALGGTSGGPVYINNQEGQAELVAVNRGGWDLNLSDSETDKLGTAVATHEFYAKAQEFMKTRACPTFKK